MKHSLLTAVLSAGLLVSAPSIARQVTVEVTNMTNAAYFTPLLVATHDGYTRLFEVGSPASGALQAMAEGGDISGLVAEVEAGGGVVVQNPAEGLLAPGQTATATFDIRPRRRPHLSVTAMVLPTNDGFIGLNGIRIPLRRGVYHYDVPVYDAGTEANDELITGGGAPGQPGIPADPGGHAGINGSGVAGADSNPNVHIHRGIVGDLDPAGGRSDLDAGVHRWLNPAARITITVGR
jgi:hypothetical protein